MAYSDYLLPTAIHGCTDDGIYYLRQLDARDGVPFEGLVWFGQSANNDPGFANVFFGELRRDVRRDERGEPVDEWDGAFFDVPKGRACGRGPLLLESLVIHSTRAGCDFPEHYVTKVAGAAFGGEVWGIESSISGCWEDRPPLPPILRAAIVADARAGFRNLVQSLSAEPVAAGFSQPANLTGIWVGDDGGSYYVRHVPGSEEVVWYAESPDAAPLDSTVTPIRAATGWSHVFKGQLRGDRVTGFWADVPRGAARGSGTMTVHVESDSLMSVTAVTGGFGGRRLWRVSTLEVTVDATTLTVEAAEEGRDEPLLYLSFFKIDGDSVDLDDLSTSSATFFHPPSTLVGDEVTGTRIIDPRNSVFSTTLRTVRSRSGADVERATRIGVIAYAFEVDDGYSNEFRRHRLMTWRSSQEHHVNTTLRSGTIPDLPGIRTHAKRILVRYLGPWEGWPWGDPDDALSGDAAMMDFAALRAGVGPVTLRFSGEGARYSVVVTFSVTSRLNPACSVLDDGSMRLVTHSRKDRGGDILALCNPGQPWSPRGTAEVIADIEIGRIEYWVEGEGRRSRVHVVRPAGAAPYLRTTGDATDANNLDNLPAC